MFDSTPPSAPPPESTSPSGRVDSPIIWSTAARLLFAVLIVLALIGGVVAALLVLSHYPSLSSTTRYRTFGVIALAPALLVILLFTLLYRGKRS